MNPKTFLAFALGCLVAGGAAFLLTSRSPDAAAVSQKAAVVKDAEAVKPVVAAEPVVVAAAPVVEAAPVVVERPVPRRQGFSRLSAAAKPSPVPVVVAAGVAVAVAEKPAAAPVAAAPADAPAAAPKFEVLPPPPAAAPAPSVTVPEKAVVKAAASAPKPNVVTIPAGTTLNIRLQESLSSEHNHPGDTFQGVLELAVVVDGFVIAERGSKVEGRVTELERSGRVKGLAKLVLELTKINTSDGQKVQVQTSAYERKGEDSKKSDAVKVGIGAAIGAAIGGIAGGGKGAATGAGVGGAAGAGQVLLTRGKAAELLVESKVSFRLQEPVTLTERLER